MRVLTFWMLTISLLCAATPDSATTGAPSPPATPSAMLAMLVEQPHLVLFEIAPQFRFASRQVEEFRRELAKEKEHERDALKQKQKSLEAQLDQAQKQPQKLGDRRSSPTREKERHDLHCREGRLGLVT